MASDQDNAAILFQRGFDMFQPVNLEAVFGQLENLVDMRELFSHLVARVGSQTFIDPHTKSDPVESLIDFFTSPEVQAISHLSAEGTTSINMADICTYLINHADQANSFSKVTKVMLKLDSSSQGSAQFSSEMIQKLKEYQASKQKLPKSYTTGSIREFYIKVKSLDRKVSEKTAEFLLYLFKCNGMVAESIDLCENYHQLVEGLETEEQARLSDIRNYYMSDCLLTLEKSGKPYYDVIKKAVFQSEQAKGAAYVASMTKAYFKDGNAQTALDFFEKEIQARVERAVDQEEHLVKLFDASFGLDSQSGPVVDL